MIYVVGFDVEKMELVAKQNSWHFEKGIYTDRFEAIKIDSYVLDNDLAIKAYKDKLKTWVRPEEAKYIKVFDIVRDEIWENKYYNGLRVWSRENTHHGLELIG